MKVEYVKSTLGFGQELHVAANDFRKANSEADRSDHEGLNFAIKAFMHEYGCINNIFMKDLEEAANHIKKDGKIILTAKGDGYDVWCEVYAIADNNIIPVKIKDGKDFKINYSEKTLQKMNSNRNQRRDNADE